MNGGVSAKITNPGKFTSYAWFIGLTPHLISTVFTRRGFHLSVLGYIIIGNIFYAISYNQAYSYTTEEIEVQNFGQVFGRVENFIQRLLTWLLSGYVMKIVQVYYIDVRKKAAEMFRTCNLVVGGIVMSVDHTSPRAKILLRDVHSVLDSMVQYSLSYASKTTKFGLNEEEIQDIFDSNGLDGSYLMSAPHKKHPISMLRLSLLSTIEEEMRDKDGGLMPILREGIRRDVEAFAGACMSVMSCVSSNKIPFAYMEFMHLFTRIFLFFHVIFSFYLLGFDHGKTTSLVPFTCFESVLSTTPGDGFCPTAVLMWYNVLLIITFYCILGCLELYPALEKVWQSSLVLSNYREVGRSIIAPIDPNNETVAGGYFIPKTISKLRNQRYNYNT